MQHKVKATYLRLPCYKQISALSISLFLMIKQSQIPYFPGFPDSLKPIFNVSGSPLFELVDVFTTAIATSLIFWFVLIICPIRRIKNMQCYIVLVTLKTYTVSWMSYFHLLC